MEQTNFGEVRLNFFSAELKPGVDHHCTESRVLDGVQVLQGYQPF
jgi:hypothetical protein